MRTLGEPAQNDSKGCGGVMRSAPVGLFGWRLGLSPQEAFRLGFDLAALTHGHPTGGLSGGFLAVLIMGIADGASLPEVLITAKDCLRQEPHHEETLAAVKIAERLASSQALSCDAIAQIGQGWVAEEALAISVYCALVAPDFREGVILAVNHDGDSDSTGAIAGNLLGTMQGAEAIPVEWLTSLELRPVISEIADDLYSFPDWEFSDNSQDIWDKYPGF
jgi:ADP-ribosylglycohydrolase